MSKFVGIAVGAVMIGVGIATGQPWLVVQGAVTIASATFLAPKLKSKRAAESSVQLGEQPRSGIFGEGCTAGSLVDAFNYGGKYGTEWTVLVIALADHKCQSLTGFFVNDKYVAFSGNGIVPGYNSQLMVYWLPGDWNDAVPAWVLSNAPIVGGQRTWTANDRGRGVCKVFVAYKADKSDAKNPVWSGGQPSFQWVVKGLLCYQARKDSTVGGSGAHRWNDAATREWTDNPIDCRYTWARGIYAGDHVDDPAMLMLGRGLSDVEAPPQNVFAPANVCDEPVALAAGGTEKRYRVGGSFGGDDAYIDTEEELAAACGGWVVEREGSVELVPGAAQPVIWDITDDDLMIGSSVTATDFRSQADDEWVNSVAVKYVEPSQKWKDHSAPVRRDISDIAEDGEPRVSQPSLALCTSGTQAQRVGEQLRRLGRLWKVRDITLPPRLVGIEHGDWIRWTSKRYGIKPAPTTPAPIIFRVESDAQNEKWQNQLSLREVSAAVYGWSTAIELQPGAVAVQNPDADFDAAPDAGSWSLSAQIVTGSGSQIPTLRFTGAVEDDGPESVIFDYVAGTAAPDPDNDGVWTNAGSAYPSVTDFPVNGLMAGATYWGAVSYIVGGMRTDRRVLGPVIMPSIMGSSGRVLLEGGGRMLLESGDQLLLEN
ncbi:phage tail protein [Sphingobium yanoikuyae]|uniref:phage tail protein n=1 Tax=Sphingobium yanoikuyae TaxID=13690 RepID=UPI001377E099|nr:hypothetical protein [Sphingobium yanoikuyae]